MMSQKYNLFKLGIAVISLFVLGIGCGERRSAQYTAVGDTQLRLGNKGEARAAYEKAIAANPTNAAAHIGLARVCRLEGDNAAALAAYEKARACDPAAAAAYIEAVDLLLQEHQTEGARKLAEAYAEHDPEHGGVLLARLESLSGDVASAIKRLQSLREKFPNSETTRISLAKLYISEGQYTEAEAELNYVLDSINADSVHAHMARVDLYARQGRVNDVVAELESFSKRRPDDITVQLAYARALLMANRVDDAEQILRPIVEAKPDNGWANFVLGECLFRKGAYDEAALCLQAARRSLPEEKAVQELLQAALNGGKPSETVQPLAGEPSVPLSPSVSEPTGERDWQNLWKQARLRKLLESSSNTGSADPEVNEFRVAAALLIDRINEAKSLASSLPETAPIRRVMSLLEQGQADPLFQFLESWKETTPLREDLRDNVLAYAYALAGRRAAAIRVLASALAQRPNFLVPLYHSAVIYAQANMTEFQIAVLRRLASLSPENIDAHAVLCDTLWNHDRNQEALTQAQVLFAAFPDDVDVLRILGKAYRQVNDLEAAAAALNRVLDKSPEDPRARIQLAEIETLRGNLERAKTLLAGGAFEGASRDAAEYLQAVNATLAANWQAAISCWEARIASNTGRTAPLALRLVCAAAYVNARDMQTARAVFDLPQDVPARTKEKAALIAYLLGDQTNVPKNIDKAWVQKLTSDKDALTDFLFVSSLVEGRLPALGEPILVRLESRVGKNPLLNILFMRVFSAIVDKKEDLARVQEFASGHPDDPAVWLSLAGIARKLGDKETERNALHEAQKLSPDTTEVLAALAEFYDREKDYPKALEVSRKLLALTPENPTVQNNLAYSILKAGGDVSEALALATAAASRLKARFEVLHTLGLAYQKKGDLSEAQKQLAAALELRPGDPTLLYDYGKTLVSLGKREEGIQHAKLAVLYARQLGVDFPEQTEADAWLQSLENDTQQSR